MTFTVTIHSRNPKRQIFREAKTGLENTKYLIKRKLDKLMGRVMVGVTVQV